jgi:hypothetical protein
MRFPRPVRLWWRMRRCAWRAMTPEGRRAHMAVVMLVVGVSSSFAIGAPTAVAMATLASTEGQNQIAHERLVFSLPVVISLMVAEAVFIATAVWWLAQYDMRRVRRMDSMHAEQRVLHTELREIKEAIASRGRGRRRDADADSGESGPAAGDVGSGW